MQWNTKRQSPQFITFPGISYLFLSFSAIFSGVSWYLLVFSETQTMVIYKTPIKHTHTQCGQFWSLNILVPLRDQKGTTIFQKKGLKRDQEKQKRDYLGIFSLQFFPVAGHENINPSLVKYLLIVRTNPTPQDCLINMIR